MFKFTDKKVITRTLFEAFSRFELIGCMPVKLEVQFVGRKYSLEISYTVEMEISPTGYLHRTMYYDYETIERIIEAYDKATVGFYLWERIEKQITYDAYSVIEGDNADNHNTFKRLLNEVNDTMKREG